MCVQRKLAREVAQGLPFGAAEVEEQWEEWNQSLWISLQTATEVAFSLTARDGSSRSAGMQVSRQVCHAAALLLKAWRFLGTAL